MKNKLILKPIIVTVVLGFAAFFLLTSGIVFGATESYLYVSQTGVVKEVSADSVSEAFEKASDIAFHSGVMIVDENRDLAMKGDYVPVGVGANADAKYAIGGSEDNLYFYVDNNGDLKPVVADTPEEAIAIAPNRDPNSGVLRANVYPE